MRKCCSKYTKFHLNRRNTLWRSTAQHCDHVDNNRYSKTDKRIDYKGSYYQNIMEVLENLAWYNHLKALSIKIYNHQLKIIKKF